MKPFEYYIPQNLIFGCGSINKLASLPLPGKKALIVTMDDHLFVDQVKDLLNKNGVEYAVYDGIRANPNTDSINEGAKFGLENKCDFVLAIGGGSPVDAGQCIALMMYENPYENDIWDYVQYYDGHKTAKGCLPIVAVSTTAGTGSEVCPGAVVSNDYLDIKLDVSSPYMFPFYSIVDPELQTSVPPYLTACQGLDVVLHCIEGYMNKNHNPYSDMLALEGLKYANAAFKTAYREPNNIEARSAMALASNLAGCVETLVDVISLHALAHTLGSIHHDITHGASLALLAPEAFQFYCTYPSNMRQRMAFLARFVGYGDSPEDLVRYIIDLLKSVDLYEIDYSEYGISQELCDVYAQHTIEKMAPYLNKDEHEVKIEEAKKIFYDALERNKHNCIK